jgi:hypothetical protein
MDKKQFTDITVSLRAAYSNQRPNKGVDKDKRMMYGVVVAQAMQIKDYRGSDYGLELDAAFINDMVTYAKKQKDGVISNYGHNYNNLNSRLGRMSAFSIIDDTAYADLSILKSADTTPGANGLGSHVLNMADEDPGMMMFSIKFEYKYMFQRDSGGKEVKCYYYDRDKQQYYYPSPELGPVYFKFDKLTSVDLVDEGAATNTLFSTQDELAAAAHQVLNAPGIEDILSKNNFPVLEQLYGANKGTSLIDSLKSLLGLTNKESHSITTKSEDVDATQFETLNAAITAKDAELAALKTENAELKTTVTAAQDALTKITERVEALEKTPLAKHEQGDEEKDQQPEVLPAFMNNPLNKNWIARQKAK